MYEDARNVGLVEHNPFANLRLPATERSEKIVAPTMEEYRALLEACTVLAGYGVEFRALIQFAAWTGLRSGEVQALQWEDVGEDAIRVRWSRRRDGSVGRPKNGQERTVSLLPPAQILDDVPRRPDPYVFHAVHGGPLLNGSLYYAWREVRSASGVGLRRREAGKANIRFHDLRHFCATQLLELGIDHFAVSVQLGHEDGGALVMARYGHPSKDAARGRLQAAFSLAADGIGSSTGSETASDAF
jgi:integrase